jgi:uncharacterized membrane protein YhaH (DUF805 family)
LGSTAYRSTRSPLWGLSGALLAVGVVLAVMPGLLRLQSTSCGPVGCDMLQMIGKVAVCVAVLAATAAIATRALRQRNYTAVALAFLIALPAAIFGGLALIGDTTEAQLTNRIARDYAAAQLGRPADELRPIILDGKLGWIAVRVTDPTGASNTVLLRRVEGEWRPQALAPSFGKEQLRALGAPTDLIRES